MKIRAPPNRSLYQQIVIERLGRYSESTIRAVWADFDAELKLSNLMITVLEQQARWFPDSKRFQTPIPDFRTVMASRFLKEINPNAVTIFVFQRIYRG